MVYSCDSVYLLGVWFTSCNSSIEVWIFMIPVAVNLLMRLTSSPLKGCVSGIGTVQSISAGCLPCQRSFPHLGDPTSHPVSHSALPSAPTFGRCKGKGRKETTISSIPQSRSYIDFQYLLGNTEAVFKGLGAEIQWPKC